MCPQIGVAYQRRLGYWFVNGRTYT
jgi:hypothetical protein